jgi:hypothetical protein
MCTVSIPCNIRHALGNEPYPLASQTSDAAAAFV